MGGKRNTSIYSVLSLSPSVVSQCCYDFGSQNIEDQGYRGSNTSGQRVRFRSAIPEVR